MAIIPGNSMCTKSSRTSVRLRVTQAYIALSDIPGSNPTAKSISLETSGAYEIRMLKGSRSHSGDASLFWMELFDHDTKSSLDSCSFYEIDEALNAFDELKSQVNI